MFVLINTYFNKNLLILFYKGFKRFKRFKTDYLGNQLYYGDYDIGIIGETPDDPIEQDKEKIIDRIMQKWNDADLRHTYSVFADFWDGLLRRSVVVELSQDKKPIASKEKRSVLTGVIQMTELLRKHKSYGLRFTSEDDTNGVVIWDFDLQKIQDEDLKKHYYRQIIHYAIDNDITLVRSASREGLHLYFRIDKDEIWQRKRSLNRILLCTITDVDILGSGGIEGPTLHGRTILNLSTEWSRKSYFHKDNLKTAPRWLHPLGVSAKQEAAILPNINDKYLKGICKGWRRRTYLNILKYASLSDQDIIDMNKYIPRPPKDIQELKSEVLEKRPSLKTIEEYRRKGLNPEDYDLDNFSYDYKTASYLWYNQEEGIWFNYDKQQITRKLEEVISFKAVTQINDMKVFLNYIRTSLGIDKVKETIGINEENQILYFKNCAICLEIKKRKIDSEILNNEQVKKHHGSVFNDIPLDLNFKKYIDKINNIGYTEYSNENLYKLFKDMAPKTIRFLNEKFDYQYKTTIRDHVTALLRLLIVCFLKNFEPWTSITLDKLFLFVGPGGSGKSTLVNWLSSFVKENRLFAGALSQLGGRFETGFLKGKGLCVFSDEDLQNHINSDKSSVCTSMLKRLSGGDKIRCETKFEDVSSFNSEAIVLISSNTQNVLQIKGDYYAMKRRKQIFTISKSIDIIQQDSNILQKILEEEFAIVCLTAFWASQDIERILKEIQKWESEYSLLKNNELTKFEKEVDPFSAFLYKNVEIDGVEKNIDNKNCKYISIRDLWVYFVQYMTFRQNSNYTLDDQGAFDSGLKLMTERPNYFYNGENIPDLLTLLPEITDNPINRNNVFIKFERALITRLNWMLPGRKLQIGKIKEKYTEKEEDTEKGEKKEVEKTAILKVILNISLRIESIDELDFINKSWIIGLGPYRDCLLQNNLPNSYDKMKELDEKKGKDVVKESKGSVDNNSITDSPSQNGSLLAFYRKDSEVVSSQKEYKTEVDNISNKLKVVTKEEKGLITENKGSVNNYLNTDSPTQKKWVTDPYKARANFVSISKNSVKGNKGVADNIKEMTKEEKGLIKKEPPPNRSREVWY